MMDVTRIYKRSDALYYGKIKRRELCDMIAHLESDLEREREKSRQKDAHDEKQPS